MNRHLSKKKKIRNYLTFYLILHKYIIFLLAEIKKTDESVH